MLEFNNVSLKFGLEQVLNGLSLHVGKYDKAVLRGSSGRGKTTAINLLLGFVKPDAGRIIWKGTPVTDENVGIIRSSVAWLPQDFKGTGTVREVIRFPFCFKRNRGIHPEDDSIRSILNSLNLNESILEKNFTDISEGQKQRIGLTICLLMDRELIILDEPTSSLDPVSKRKVIELFLQNEKLTVLSTSHDAEWTGRCNRVIDLED